MDLGVTGFASLALMAAVASASPAVLGTPTSRMVSSPLMETEVEQILKCVKATKEAYKVGVDDSSYIVVSPSIAGAMDYKGKEQGLLECMKEVSDFLKTAAESSLFEVPHDGAYQPITEVDYVWLSGKGAEGHKREELTRVRAAAPSVNTQYYNFYANLDKGCGSTDLLTSNIEEWVQLHEQLGESADGKHIADTEVNHPYLAPSRLYEGEQQSLCSTDKFNHAMHRQDIIFLRCAVPVEDPTCSTHLDHLEQMSQSKDRLCKPKSSSMNSLKSEE